MKLGISGAAALLLAGLVALLALSSSTGPGGSVAAGTSAPDFTVRTVDGKRFSLADQRGNVTVVEFLQAGCASCAVDVAGLSKMAVQKQSELSILVADIGGLGPGALRDYYRGDLDAPAELLIAPASSKLARAYDVQSLGDTIVVDPERKVSWKGRWAGDAGLLRAQIEAAGLL